jgi:anhydro-N-acetylmuramic acid kinase
MTDPILAIGLMSGTSRDGIDAALLRSDGEGAIEAGAWLTEAYDDGFRDRLASVVGGRGDVAAVERELTLRHADAVRRLLRSAGLAAADIGLCGFHGHTIRHEPQAGRTWQIGDGALLAAETGIDVVADFRSADMAAGGEGAPLAPLFHAGLAGDLARPVAVLNVGGVANVTWIGPPESPGALPALLAFDTGPGNALSDDWAQRHTGRPVDQDGALARAGRVDGQALAALLEHDYFARPAPKSLDRDDFSITPMSHLAPADGAATLIAFTASAVARGAAWFPAPAARWLVTGGGRRNPALMAALAAQLAAPVAAVEEVGWQGDALEAQAFAYLAVRSRRGLALSVPGSPGRSAAAGSSPGRADQRAAALTLGAGRTRSR